MVRPAAPLERALGPLAASALLAGTVIGTGIFLVPSTIARETGSLEGTLAIWVLGAIISLLGALSYAELGAALPEAGGEYAFLRHAYGPSVGFLFGWQQIVMGKTGSIAAIGLASSLFIGYLVPGLLEGGRLDQSGWVNTTQLMAISWIVLLTLANLLGAGAGGFLQTLLTALKILAIIALIVLAFQLGEAQTSPALGPERGIDQTPLGQWTRWGAALSAALWAYDGWNNLTLVSGEIKNPDRTIPRILITGLVMVSALYLATNLAYFHVLPLGVIQSSSHVAQDLAQQLLGEPGARYLTLAAVLSTLAALNGAILSGARVFYAMSRDGLFFHPLAKLHPRHRTPRRALLLQMALATGLILLLGRDQAAFERVLDYALFGTWGFYGLTAFAVIRLRQKAPSLERPFKTPGYPWIPGGFVGVAMIFCANIAYRRPEETIMGLLLLAAGVPFFLWRQKQRPPAGTSPNNPGP